VARGSPTSATGYAGFAILFHAQYLRKYIPLRTGYPYKMPENSASERSNEKDREKYLEMYVDEEGGLREDEEGDEIEVTKA
jgi:hypothetical protein